MFSSVELKEFGGVRGCEKPVKLHRFTVLIGPNNSAKTTLLTALFMFPYPWADHNLPFMDLHKIQFLRQFLYKEQKALAYRYSGQGQLHCTLKDKGLRFEFSEGQLKKIYDDGKEYVDSKAVLELLELKGALEKNPTQYTLLIPNSDKFREMLANSLRDHWSDVEKSGAHVRLVREFVSKVVEDRFTEVYVRFQELMLRKELPSGEPYSVELRHVGDGVKRFLTSALWLETVKPEVVLWDDLEVAAHPSLTKGIIEWLAGHGWQVIASTHSIDVLNELVLAAPEGARVIALRKLQDDTLTHREYTLEELENLFESGLDVRKLLV